MAEGTAPWPTRLSYDRSERVLTVAFDDGQAFQLPAELLRVETPSAERRGHGREEPKLVTGKRDVAITAIEPVGNYAVRIAFDDGHDSGLYGWSLLHRLGAERDRVWSDYLAALAARNLSRER